VEKHCEKIAAGSTLSRGFHVFLWSDLCAQDA
jgi:hypothetical protein